MADKSNKNFDPIATLDRYPIPILTGPRNAVDSYYKLKILERSVANQTLRQHHEATSLWYRGIKLLHDPILGVWELTDASVENGWRRKAEMVQSAIIGLEATSAKAALDQLLRGNYSIAFAAIRHMLEAFAQMYFLTCYPQQAFLWTEGDKRSPGMSSMINSIKYFGSARTALINEPFDTVGFDRLYDAWSLMSKGSHPTGGGLTQVQPEHEDDTHSLGAYYREQLAYVGFDNGLFALKILLDALALLRTPGDSWAQEMDASKKKVNSCRVGLLRFDWLRDLSSSDQVDELESFAKEQANQEQ